MQDTTSHLAAIGGRYAVGSATFRAEVRALALLAEVSPTLANGEGAVSELDLARGLYALCNWQAAADTLLGLRARQASLARVAAAMPELTADKAALLLSAQEQADAGQWAEFDRKALDFYAAHCGDVGPQAAADTICQAVVDAYAAWRLIPRKVNEGGGQDETTARPSLAARWRASWRLRLKWVSRLLPPWLCQRRNSLGSPTGGQSAAASPSYTQTN